MQQAIILLFFPRIIIEMHNLKILKKLWRVMIAYGFKGDDLVKRMLSRERKL